MDLLVDKLEGVQPTTFPDRPEIDRDAVGSGTRA